MKKKKIYIYIYVYRKYKIFFIYTDRSRLVRKIKKNAHGYGNCLNTITNIKSSKENNRL